MGSRHRLGMVSRLLRYGRDCFSSPPVRHRNRRRPDPDIQRSLSPRTLGLVALPGAPRWPYPGPGLRTARIAAILHQPCTSTPGARQDAELELPARHRCAWRVAANGRKRLPCKIVSLARRLIESHRSIASPTFALRAAATCRFLRARVSEVAFPWRSLCPCPTALPDRQFWRQLTQSSFSLSTSRDRHSVTVAPLCR